MQMKLWVPYPFTSMLKKSYAHCPEDLFLAWSTICFCAGQVRSTGSIALTQTAVDQ